MAASSIPSSIFQNEFANFDFWPHSKIEKSKILASGVSKACYQKLKWPEIGSGEVRVGSGRQREFGKITFPEFSEVNGSTGPNRLGVLSCLVPDFNFLSAQFYFLAPSKFRDPTSESKEAAISSWCITITTSRQDGIPG